MGRVALCSRGPHGTALGWAVVLTGERWRRGRRTSRSGGGAFTTLPGTRVGGRWGGACHWRRGRGSRRRGGQDTFTPCSMSTRRMMCGSRSATCATSLGWLRDTVSGSSVRIGEGHAIDGRRSSCGLSASYFVRGRGSKATLQENARNPHLPRMLIWGPRSSRGQRA